jgi:hypothetical protein
LVVGALFLRDAETSKSALGRLLSTEPDEDGIVPLVGGLASAIMSLSFVAHHDVTARCQHRLEQIAARTPEQDDLAMACIEYARATWMFSVERDHWAALEQARASVVHSERAGDRSQMARSEIYVGLQLAQLGLLTEAESHFLNEVSRRLRSWWRWSAKRTAAWCWSSMVC